MAQIRVIIIAAGDATRWNNHLGIPDDLMDWHLVSDRNFNSINDWTDDFDYPEDYERFIRRRKEWYV